MDPINKMGEGLFMVAAGKKEIRVRGHIKRVFLKMVEVSVHSEDYSMQSPIGKPQIWVGENGLKMLNRDT